jgi:glycerol-3-phosphate dehydrogenase
MTEAVKTDVLIVGGGIAGLWLCNLLQARGYQCLLLETGDLGGEQTLLSQGIIHGGLKYALGGTLSNESEAIAAMPDRWRQCLDGNGDIDLRGTRVLSDTQHLWSAGSVASRVTTFFASKMLRGRISKLPFEEFPSALRDRQFRGNVYRLADLVVDTPSLLDTLRAPVADRLIRFDPATDRIDWQAQGVTAATVSGVRIEPGVTVLAAGAGNEALLKAAGEHQLAADIRSQRRPLHMALVRHTLGHRLYAHCVGASNKPRLTVTTHDLDDGSLVWYLGGDLAERGVDMNAAELEQATRKELLALFPWLDFSAADIRTVRVDRAEPLQDALVKPDNAYAVRRKNLVVTWPTKLTLAPDLGDRVCDLLADLPATAPATPVPAALPRCQVARPRWQQMFGDGHD